MLHARKMAPRKRSPCKCGYGRTLNEMKNLNRHLSTCLTSQDVCHEQSSEIARLRARVQELEDGSKVKQNEINELKDKLIKALEDGKNKRQKTVINNNVKNMTINVSYAFGEEPRLTSQNVSYLIKNCFEMEDVVPQYLKQKHFARSETSNIRLDFSGDSIETVRKDAKTGQLKWKRERKNAQKFCQDLAMTTVEELNDVYNATSNVPWRAYCNNRFGKNADPEMKKQYPEQKLGVQVKNMILDNS